MTKPTKIITVGLSPSWDMVCQFDGIDWGDHKLVDSAACTPAGKALNISRALAWTGTKSIAAGLWGRDDYDLMKKAMTQLRSLIKLKMTPVQGNTRRNVTVVDLARNREMHLRSKCGLASKKALNQLRADLKPIVKKNNICVFAGLMPQTNLLPQLIRIITDCTARGAKIAIDSHGQPLKRIVDTGAVWLIKPNVEELRELLAENIPDRPPALAKAAKRLLNKVQIILISRGKKGAIVVTPNGAWQAKCTAQQPVQSTVGCGDYLLAGFLKAITETQNPPQALKTALKLSTAKAWSWPNQKPWPQTQRQIRIEGGRV